MQNKFYIAVKAMIFHDGKLLLIKRSEAARGDSGFWEFPGGRLEFGESPETALHREVQEEVGLEVKIVRPLTVWSFLKDEETQVVGLTFLCKTGVDAVKFSEEHGEYIWTAYNDLGKYNLVAGMLDGLQEADVKDVVNLAGEL